MPEYFTLQEENRQEIIDYVLLSVRKGEIVVLAAEIGYIYACDAFQQSAVNEMHLIRGDDDGVAAQVFIGEAKVLPGIAADYDEDVAALTKAFWPGLLTLQMRPHPGLNWDLGDHGELPEFAVRVPSRPFLLELLKVTGPLAVSSAAISGRPPTNDINFVPAMATDIGAYVDEGPLASALPSTIVRRSIIGVTGGLEVAREGAISLAELQAALPSILPRAE